MPLCGTGAQAVHEPHTALVPLCCWVGRVPHLFVEEGKGMMPQRTATGVTLQLVALPGLCLINYPYFSCTAWQARFLQQARHLLVLLIMISKLAGSAGGRWPSRGSWKPQLVALGWGMRHACLSWAASACSISTCCMPLWRSAYLSTPTSTSTVLWDLGALADHFTAANMNMTSSLPAAPLPPRHIPQGRPPTVWKKLSDWLDDNAPSSYSGA